MTVLLVDAHDRHGVAELIAGLDVAVSVRLGQRERFQVGGAFQGREIVDQVHHSRVDGSVQILPG